MKKKITLPFEDKPYSLMYHGSAFPLGIIQGNTEQDLIPWLSSKYINCYFSPAFENKFSYYVTDHWATRDKILLRQHIDLYPEEYNMVFKSSIINLFRKMLDLGYYPHGSYNEEYIPGKDCFQKEYYNHNFILIGYNDIEKNFISVGYLKDKKFQRYKIPYDCMEMAISTHKSPKISFNFWKFNEEAQFTFNYDRLIIELDDYLHSTTSLKINKQNRKWGMDAIRDLGYYIMNTCKNENYIDHRYTRGIMEQKNFMKMRIDYLINHNYLNQIKYSDFANEVHSLAESGHLLSIKFRITENKKIAEEINKIYQRMLDLEKLYLFDAFEDLQKNHMEATNEKKT